MTAPPIIPLLCESVQHGSFDTSGISIIPTVLVVVDVAPERIRAHDVATDSPERHLVILPGKLWTREKSHENDDMFVDFVSSQDVAPISRQDVVPSCPFTERENEAGARLVRELFEVATVPDVLANG